ncbi:hypothetical protein MNB_SM-7-1021 [hydrothermal vent metagenome]|uniref:Uncharacterized protein n=1 Tax=hydrothermal vent metagenome TaxID=652676 RepID=A0A1W1BKT5_9ZZZZ
MKRIFLLLTVAVTLFAKNPTIFASLGDTIYNNAAKIEKLKEIKEYSPFFKRIEDYVKSVRAVKKLGFAIETGKIELDKKIYLDKLREFKKTNDFFIRNVNFLFEKALKTKNYELVMNLLDTGLIDIKQNRDRLLRFYEDNKGSFELRGVLKELVNEDQLRKKPKHTKEYYERLKRLKEQEKIRRLRMRDKKRQEALQKRLEEELKRKKEQIQQEQIKELNEEEL